MGLGPNNAILHQCDSYQRCLFFKDSYRVELLSSQRANFLEGCELLQN